MATLIHLKMIFQLAGLEERASIGLDFEAAMGVNETHLGQLIVAAKNGWISEMEPRFPASSRLFGVAAYSYAIVAGKRQIDLGPIEVPHFPAGTGGGTALPPQNSICATHRTNLSSRRTRGRVYLPPSRTTDVQSDGLIQSAYQGQLETSYNAFVVGCQNAPVAPQQFTHVVASLTGGTVRAVTSRQINNRIDTQRRRLPR